MTAKKPRRRRPPPSSLRFPADKRWLALIPLFFVVNFLVQIARVPSQATGPLEPYFYKTPPTAWKIYGTAFQSNATSLLSAPFLAALAQVEAAGNPIATTYWKWTWSWNPFRWYAPASSAAGLFQITDGNFAVARRFCIQDGRAVAQGKWYEWKGCWLNFLYNRLSANHATEMTSAYLDHETMKLLSGLKVSPSLLQKRRTAALIHLCGVGVAERFARTGFKISRGQNCGDHSASAYLKQVEQYQATFEKLAQKGN